MTDIKKVREQFPITNEKVYLAHASRGPLPKCAADAIKRYVHDSIYSGMTLIDAGVTSDGGRPLFAKLIGGKPKEIAFVENTSMGLNIAAGVLDFKRKQVVVTTDYEYSSVIYPFLREKMTAEVRFVENINGRVPLEVIEKEIDDNTAAVVISHVHWLNGFRYDLRALSEIAHEHGALLIVDAIQSAGAMKIDVRRQDVDFLTAGCYKWLLSLPGSGYLYVREELIEELNPPLAGWRSSSGIKDRNHKTLKFPADARRFEVGAPSYVGLVGANESMKLLLNAGRKFVEKRVLMLTEHLINSLKDLNLRVTTPEDSASRSGIVNFQVENPQKVVEILNEKRIIPCGARAEWVKTSLLFRDSIRVAPHFYNTVEEIDAFVDSIREIIGSHNR